MTFSPKNLVNYEGQQGAYTFYKIEPWVLYPAALQDLVETKKITFEEGILAVTPRDATPDEKLSERAAILQRARLHFNQVLLDELGDGIGIHILNGPDWRL